MSHTSDCISDAQSEKGRKFAVTLMTLPFALLFLLVVCAIIQGPKAYPLGWEFEIPQWSAAKVAMDMAWSWCTEFWPLFGSVPPIIAGLILYFQPKDKGSVLLGVISLIPFGLLCFLTAMAVALNGGRINS